MAGKGAAVTPEVDLEAIRSVKELPILAIDDDASILRFFERTLPKWGFTNIFSAARPEEGLRMLAEYAFALVLVDYQMPGMNGHQFREQANDISPDTLHVLITAHGDVHGEGKLAEDTMESDFYGYIDKPFQPNTLRAQIRGGLNAFLVGRQQQLIKNAKDEWLETMDNLPHAVFRADPNNRLLRLNRQALRHVGAAHYTDVIGRDLRELVPQARALIAGMHETAEAGTVEAQIADRHYTIRAVPLLYGRSGYNLTLTDITVLMNAMERCARADRLYSLGLTRATVAHDIRDFQERMRAALLALRAAFQHFCLGVDAVVGLRRSLPLLGKGYAQLEHVMHDMGVAVRKACDTDAQLEQRLDLEMKMAATLNDPALHRRPTGLRALLQRFVRIVADDFPAARLVLEAERLPPVEIDEISFFTVFYNLCRNAVEAGHDCRIGFRLSFEEEEHRVRIAVSDDAGGMEQRAEARAFEPFFSTKEAAHHMGFGLNSVQRTVRAHGGRIRLENRPREGVTVDIELPVEADGHAATFDTHRS